MTVASDLLAFVRASLPPAPARVLEVGAGDGELAAALRDAGYDVLAVDPAGEAPGVDPVALLDVDAPGEPFDAAVAVVSLHHVEPLQRSCDHLAALVRPGGRLVVDELDSERFDERAARWWLARRAEAGEHEYPRPRWHEDEEAAPHDHADHGPPDPASMVADLRTHVHPLVRVRAALAQAFALGAPVRGPYLHRWALPPGLLEPELEAIAGGEIPAIGARLAGTRR